MQPRCFHTMSHLSQSASPPNEHARHTHSHHFAVVDHRPRLPRGDLARVGLDLPRHQVRTAELSALLPDGHALSVRGRLADGVDAVSRRPLARCEAMAQRADRWCTDAWWGHGWYGIR